MPVSGGESGVGPDLLFVVRAWVVEMVLKDMVWAGVVAAVCKYFYSDVMVVDGGKGREGVLV